MSPGIASSMSVHVLSLSLFCIGYCICPSCLHFSVCTPRSHDTVTSSYWQTGLYVCVCVCVCVCVLCISNCILCIAHWYLKQYCFFRRFPGYFRLSPVKIKMNMEHWCNIDREKPKNWDEKRSQCHFVHHKCYWTGPRSNSGFDCERLATSLLMHGTACVTFQIYK